ncbi:fimbrial protein [Sapientia aquatica]|nr:fimbrial protein [Sapientia aquatica]
MSFVLAKNKEVYLRWLARLFVIVAISATFPSQVYADCYRIENPVASRNILYKTSVYVEPTTNGRRNEVGTMAPTGLGTGTASGVVPPSYNLSSTLFQPFGTLLFAGVGSSTEMAPGGFSPYVPEQVLFRCTSDEVAKGLFEFFATDAAAVITACQGFSGQNPDGDQLGVPGAYRTRLPELGLRLTHINSGKVVQNRWASHRLTGLDTDSFGYVLVKVKNFSSLKAEMFRINNRSYLPEVTWASIKSPCKIAANAVYVFKWSGSPGAQADGVFNNGTSYPPAYVGRFNLGNGSDSTNVGSCGSTIVNTPNVIFPSITVTELNNGIVQTQPFSVSFKCQFQGNSIAGSSAFVSGTGVGQIAMGFAIQNANQQSALAQGLGVSGSSTAVTYLLSDGYGTDSAVATNVGTQITWAASGTPLNFALYNPASNTGSNADGWYGVTTNAIGGGVDASGYQYFTQNFNATFKKLPGKTVMNSGKYSASAQFIIRVQ